MAERESQLRIVNDFFVRKADLDDVQVLNTLISEENRADLNVLFDYPKLTTLFERYYCCKIDLIYHWLY